MTALKTELGYGAPKSRKAVLDRSDSVTAATESSTVTSRPTWYLASRARMTDWGLKPENPSQPTYQQGADRLIGQPHDPPPG